MKFIRICIGALVIGFLVLAAFLGKKQLARSYDKMGNIKRSQGDPDGAIKEYDHAIALDPKYEWPWNNRGIIKKDRGDFVGAIADYTRAIELKPDFVAAYDNRGWARYCMNDLDGAIADYNRSIEIAPRNPAPYNNRGIVKDDKGDTDGAIADYNRTIELNPGDKHAYINRANTMFQTRRWTEALADYRQACAVATGDTDYPHLYIWLLRARQGQADDANKELAFFLTNRLRDDKKAISGDWVSKLGAYLLDNITEKELFAAAVSADPRKDSGQHCEAWLFTGMKKLIVGDKQTAASCFHKCMDTKRNDFIEFQMAMYELKALGE